MKAKFVNALNEKVHSMGSLYHIEKWIKQMWEKMEAKFATDEELGEFFTRAENVIGPDACQFIDQQASADFLHYHQNGPYGGADTSDFIENFDDIKEQFESLLNSRSGNRRRGSFNEGEEPVRFTGNPYGSVERSRGQGWPGMGGWGDPLQTAVLHGERGRQERAAEKKREQRVTTPAQQERIDARYNKKLEAIRQIENQIDELESELEDLQDKIKEGPAWEIEEFFAELGSEASNVVNSGISYKQKIQALEDLGVEDPKDVMNTYDYYYPMNNIPADKLQKIEDRINKIKTKIQSLKAKKSKLRTTLYENINEHDNYGFEDEKGDDFDYDTRDSEVEWVITTPEEFDDFISSFRDEIDGICQATGGQCANDKMDVINNILAREGVDIDTEGWEDI